METKQIAYDVCRSYLDEKRLVLGEVLYQEILGKLRARDIGALCTLTSGVDWHCISVDVIRSLLQVESFFKKNRVFSDEDLCSKAAFKSFVDCEKACRIANRRLDHYFFNPGRLDPDVRKWMVRAESYIQRVLGSFDKFHEEIPRYVRLTSGATSTQSRRRSLPYLKVKKVFSCPEAGHIYLTTLNRFFGYGPLRLVSSACNRVLAVPKNYKTHRLIACEPDGALPFQLAFDTYCKSRLKKFKIDLSDQFQNQELARVGSIDGSLATVDLSCASDTVAFNAVAWLFPLPWFQYLRRFRSTHYTAPIGSGKYAKFSSMGNGSTFCIETLIFASACYAVGSERFSIYGDDIIIESSLVPKLHSLLKFLGFTLNLEKSFWDKPFRESCGSSWFRGIDVTPFYLRMAFWSKPAKCHVVNNLVALSDPHGPVWEWCQKFISEAKLPFVPFNESSISGVWLDSHISYREKLIRRRNEIVYARMYVSKTCTRDVYDSRTLFLWYLDSLRRRNLTPYSSLNVYEVPFYRKLLSNIAWFESVGCREPLVRSLVPVDGHKYHRKWVCWHPMPAGLTTDHIYMWSAYIARHTA